MRFRNCIEEYFRSCFVTQHFSRPVIEPVLNDYDLSVGDILKLCPLGEVISDQSVGMFIKPSLP